MKVSVNDLKKKTVVLKGTVFKIYNTVDKNDK
jgi:hypothetical protein